MRHWIATQRRRLEAALDSPRTQVWVLVIGIAFTLVGTRIAWEAADREARMQGNIAAERISSRIIESLAEYESLLRVAGHMIAPSAVNSLEGIRGFLLEDILTRHYSGATFLAFVRRVPHAELPAYERFIQSRLTVDENGIASVRLQAGPAPVHYFLESNLNVSAKSPPLGTDFSADPPLVHSIQAAASSRGLALITSRSPDAATGFQPPALLAPLQNPLSRNPDGETLGFLVLGLDFPHLVDTVLASEPAGTWDIVLSLAQNPSSTSAAPAAPTKVELYASRQAHQRTAGSRHASAGAELQRELAFGGTRIAMTVRNQRASVTGLIGYLPWLVLLACASIATLSYLAVRRTQVARLRAEALAHMRGAEARQSDQRFRDLVESSSDWIWELDRGFRFTYASPNTHVLLGIAPEELLGRRMDTLALLGREGKALPVFPFPATAPQAYNSHERQLLRSDGTLRTFESSASLVVDERGRFAGLRGIDRDVTEQRRIQMQIADLRDKLSENMRANLMEQMLTGLAHELNQPLSAITTYSQACVRLLEMNDPDIAKVRDAMRSTASHALLAADIVKGLRRLTTSRTPHIVRTAVEPLLRNAMTLVDFRIRAAGIELQLEITPSLPFVWADTVLLTQVCLNLLHNAIDALAHSTEKRIRVRAHADSHGNVAIDFLDTGHGIDLKNAERIFDTRFTTKSEGMGLGLTISRSIMEALNGSLSYAPGPQGGSMFTLTLPFRQVRPS